MSVSTAELSKAIETLEESLELCAKAAEGSAEKKAFRDASIQRFEYGVELSWKVSMKVLGSATAAAKIAVREMARSGLIDDPQIWFDFIEARNNTSHSYDEDIARKVYQSAEKLPTEAHKLIQKLIQK